MVESARLHGRECWVSWLESVGLHGGECWVTWWRVLGYMLESVGLYQ